MKSSSFLPADSWRSSSVTDGLKNGEACGSSLAAKGFRSVRPNLQDKKSPTQVGRRSPLPVQLNSDVRNRATSQSFVPMFALTMFVFFSFCVKFPGCARF